MRIGIRAIILGMLIMAAAAGALMYYLLVYAFYVTTTTPEAEITVVSLTSGAAEPIPVSNLREIHRDNSPISYRACFDTVISQATLTDAYQTFAAAEPQQTPGWFDCFDGAGIGAALASGEAIAFLSQPDEEWGIDRVIAVLPDGRGYAWRQVNACGVAFYGGEETPADCPPQPESAP